MKTEMYRLVFSNDAKKDLKELSTKAPLATKKLQMLFVNKTEQGRGFGSQLIAFAVRHKRIFRVDVNEQNEKALSFYLNRGFVPVRRDETDPNGRPFPILHLSLPETTR